MTARIIALSIGVRLAAAFAAGFLAPSPATAQETEPERCPRFVVDYRLPDERLMPASYVVPVQAAEKQVRLTYIGHSTFLIESPAGVTIATDYNDGVRPDITPRIITMNRAHPTHYTFNPPPGIEYILHGWGDDGEPARHELTVDDVWLRNVTTNIRGYTTGPMRDQNSIFVFEVAELCIAHLGHLHHTLTEDHLKALGRIDVVLVPVDGGYTLNVDDMIQVLKQIGAPLVIPMHYFGQVTLANFLARLGESYVIQTSDVPSVMLSRDGLPKQATVLVLPGY
jgi:L-ascorbate metabolism protein UlaG (beta-lactamase superfamily)